MTSADRFELMLELALNPAFAVSSIAFVVAVRVNPGGGMRHMKTDYKIDRTPYVHPLGSRAGPTAVALGGALPASPQQFGFHPSNSATAPRFQPTTRQPERLPQPERPARVPPPQQPQPPPPQQPQQHEQPPPPPPPPQQQPQQPQQPPPQPPQPPSLPEPELYESLLQLHRLCGGDLTRCIEVAARVHRLPKHRVFEMFRLMLAARALSDVPESSPASSASGPPPTAPVHSRLPPPPPLPPEQPATAPPATGGARAWSLAPPPRYTARALPQSSGGLPAAAAPGLPAVSPLWQQQQQQQQPYQQLPYQQPYQPQPQPPQPPQQLLLQPQHRQLQPQIQHQHQHQHQPSQPAPPPAPPPQQHRQQQQAYTQGELQGLLQQSAGQRGQVDLWQEQVQQATPPQQVQVRQLQARQLQLQQRQVPLVITPDHSHSRS